MNCYLVTKPLYTTGIAFQMFARQVRQILYWQSGAGWRGLADTRAGCVLSLPSQLVDYSQRQSSPLPPPLSSLQSDSSQTFSNSHLMTASQVLRLNMVLCRVLRANKVLDIGVFTGSSSLAAAQSTGDNSTIFALEKSKKYIEFARKYWRQAGVENKIEVMIGNAADSLNQLINSGHEGSFDFIYIDADKSNYPEYFRLGIQLARSGGLLAVDNTLFRGQVLDKNSDNKTVRSIQRFNEFARDCPDVTVVILPLSDGLTLAIKN